MIFRIALASAFCLSRALAATVDYTINVAGTPVTVNGISDGQSGEELTMHFTLPDSSGVVDADIVCQTHKISGGQCDTTSSIPAVVATKKNIDASGDPDLVDVGININLETIGTSAGAGTDVYTYDSSTYKGTLIFCTRCTTHTTGNVVIDYAEIQSTVTMIMSEDVSDPVFNVEVMEDALTTDTKADQATDYAITATRCVKNGENSYTDEAYGSATALGQGDYVGLCVRSTTAGIKCAHYEELTIGEGGDTVTFVTGGDISNTALTEGNDSNTLSTDGTCFIKTQFPASLIPLAGTKVDRKVAGTVLIKFQESRRTLRVDLARALQSEQAGAAFEMDVEMERDAKDPFATSGAMGLSTGLFGAAVALVVAAM